MSVAAQRNRRTLGATATIALGLFCTGCSQVFWRPDLGGAMRMAGQRNQVVLVAYWSALNEDCMRMDREVFTDDQVVETLRGVVPVKLSTLTSQRFAEDYGLTTVPSFVIFGPEGQVLRTSAGYMDEASFRGMVQAAKMSL
jgi:thiol:disulfide interchange protein